MNFLKHTFAMLLCGIITLPAQSIHLTLDSAITRILSASPQIREAEQNVAAAKSRAQLSHSRFYPAADAHLSYARVSPVSAATFGPTVFQLNPANNYDGHVDVNAVLYDFDKRKIGEEISESAVDRSQYGIEQLKERLSYQAVTMFYTILFIQKSIEVHNSEITTLQEHLDITRKKVQSGTATDLDILTIEVRITAAKNKSIDLENALARAQIRLKEAAHIPGDDSVQLAGSFDPVTLSIDNQAVLEQALGARVELRGADNAISAASLQKNLAGLGNYPSLHLHASYGIKNGFFPNIDAWRGNYVAAVELSIPVFDGFTKDYREDEAAANLNAAEERKNSITQEVRTEVLQAITDVRSGEEKVKTAQAAIDQAQRALEIARIRYESGAVTNLDLLDAETSVTNARFQKVQAQYNLVLSNYELKQAEGTKIYSENAVQ